MRNAFSVLALAAAAMVLWGGCSSAGGTTDGTAEPAGAVTGAGGSGGTSSPGAGGGVGAGGSSGVTGVGGATSAGGDGGGGSSGGSAGQGLSLGGGGTGGDQAPSHLKGKVVAPEGTIPISGALVYVSPTPPPPIPDGVYCDKCVHLDASIPFTKTNPDGTFSLPLTPSTGFLVVQKGAFRRVRPITVVTGDQDIPLEMTTMPPRMDKANGDDIPKIAVVLGAWDPIEIVLARMGLDATITKNGLGIQRVLSKDATAFAIYGLHDLGEKSPYPTGTKLLTDPTELEKYHIVFIPCSGGSNSGGDMGPQCSGVFNPAAASTLESFVRQGGRVYASDWSYEYVRQIFQGFVTWNGETSEIGSACMGGGGEEVATVEDPGLQAWLTAQNQSLDSVKDAWTSLDGVHPTMDVDPDGNAVTETPKVWVDAGPNPATTSFRHGCGRVLYSTYHTQPTSEVNGPLEPQALTLLYLILEVGVCVDIGTTG